MAIVCSCNGVSDRIIRHAIEQGARCVDSIGEHCRAGVGCGGCHDSLRQALGEHAPAGGLRLLASAS